MHNIISVSLLGDSVLKHASNIRSISEAETELEQIKEWEPVIAGGFPMSLLFAPRNDLDNTKIKRGYYHDFDMYFKNEDRLEAAKRKLLSRGGRIQSDTDNATTVRIRRKDYQLIKIFREEPLEIINHFDFTNCACAYTPADKTIHFHRDTITWHINRELQILNPWMITGLTDDTPDDERTARVITQLLRFKKYCHRWNYQLSDRSYRLLMAIYKRNPDITIRRTQYVPMADQGQGIAQPTSGTYSYLSLGRPGQNVWDAMADMIIECPSWNREDDIHNKIMPNTTAQNTPNSPTMEQLVDELTNWDDIPF